MPRESKTPKKHAVDAEKTVEKPKPRRGKDKGNCAQQLKTHGLGSITLNML